MNTLTVPRFDAELRISPRPVLIVLAISGILVGAYLSMASAGESLSSRGLSYALITWALSAALWFLEDWRPLLGRWATIAALAIVIPWVGQWFALAGFLALLSIPIALAAALISPPAAALTAVAQTILILLLPQYAQQSVGETMASLIAIWVMLGLMYAIYQPVLKLSLWSWEHFSRARELLDEARDRQVELKQALDDLAHANRQLALINERLAATRLIAEEAQKTKAEFVAQVSHEFRTPLNMIIGLIDLLMETPKVYGEDLPEALFKDLGIVHRNCEHLASMINDVLDLSQIEAGRLALHREEFSLADVILRALAVVRPLLDKKGLSLKVDIAQDLPRIHCDRTRIRQVILNLVSNAARLTEAGGLTVQARADGRFVVVSVNDTGPGISPEDKERIFEPFYQGAKVWRSQSGSGLGLSISKQFVEMHGGQMWVESQFGAGSAFFFRLPIHPFMDPVAPPQRWIAESWVDRSPKSQLPASHFQQRVVLCDESGDLHPVLERYADDIEFVDVRNLEQAERELQHAAARAVLINAASVQDLIGLVEQAGREMPDTPIIGCSLPPRMEQAHTAGASGYLLKPLLLAGLEEALDATGQELARVLVVDDDPDALPLLTRMLQIYDPALEVVTASNGQQALDMLRSTQPDLMLLDILLPDLDGRQVLTIKGQEEAIRDIPVIVISAQDPRDQPLESKYLVATMGRGLSVSKLLRSTRDLAQLLLQPD
jgi:signal transduction histidine kinase/CheY-like chemotaxis protein